MSPSDSGDRPTLSSRDALGSTEQLRAEALRALPPGASSEPPDRQEATDHTGSVQVTVDARGRPVAVDIDSGWRSRLAPADLPAALHEAYTAAGARAGEAWAVASLAATERGEPLPDGGGSRAPEALPRAPSDPAEWSTWISRQQDRIHAEREARRRSDGPAERQHQGPHGYLTATVRGRSVVALTGDTAGLAHVDTALLQQDALDVLAAAQRPHRGTTDHT